MMKVATMVLCKYMDDYLARVVKECLKYSERVFIMNNRGDWEGIKVPIADRTLEIYQENFCCNDKVEYVCGDWKTEEDQRNAGLDLMQDYDWALIIEADEFLLEGDYRLLEGLLDSKYDAYLAKPMIEYWKGPGHVLDPYRTYEPVIAVNPKVRFYDKRCVSVQRERFRRVPITIHHMSYCFPGAKMEWKMKNWWDIPRDKREETYKGWYEEKWLGWDQDHSVKGLYMCHPEGETGAIPCVVNSRLAKALEI